MNRKIALRYTFTRHDGEQVDFTYEVEPSQSDFEDWYLRDDKNVGDKRYVKGFCAAISCVSEMLSEWLIEDDAFVEWMHDRCRDDAQDACPGLYIPV